MQNCHSNNEDNISKMETRYYHCFTPQAVNGKTILSNPLTPLLLSSHSRLPQQPWAIKRKVDPLIQTPTTREKASSSTIFQNQKLIVEIQKAVNPNFGILPSKKNQVSKHPDALNISEISARLYTTAHVMRLWEHKRAKQKATNWKCNGHLRIIAFVPSVRTQCMQLNVQKLNNERWTKY